MELHEKILSLRKRKGMSQEDLAERLNLSRQAISRWENGLAKPDVDNILQLSKLFKVSTDYLLNNEYGPDDDVLPRAREVRKDNTNQLLFSLIILMVINLILQFACIVILQNIFF